MRSFSVTVTVDQDVLDRVDRAIAEGAFPNRSRAFQEAIVAKLRRPDWRLLARECAKLSPAAEQAMADEGGRSADERAGI